MDIGMVKERGGRGADVRVPVMPAEAAALTAAGHRLVVERGAGVGVYATDEAYRAAGAIVVDTPAEAFNRGLVVKLKAPAPEEAALLRPGAIVLTMLHQAQSPASAEAIARAGAVAVALEAVCNEQGDRLFDCTAMSGSQAVLAAFHYLERVPEECRVLVMGYGRVATGAVVMASRLGAQVKILRRCMHKDIEHYLTGVHILVNGLAWPREKRERGEHLVTRRMLSLLGSPAMVVDLAVDEPGPIETCRATDLREPTYFVEGVRHLCVYGYPALAPVSSSERYSRQLLPMVLEVAAKGIGDDLSDPILRAVVDWRDRAHRRSHQVGCAP